jgi:hypothetical protein
MAKFYCDGDRIANPEDIIPFLAAQEKHWRKGRSAYELAHLWMDAGGIPRTVKDVLAIRSELAGAELLEGHFERSTEIPGRGRKSQTDLLAICETAVGKIVIGVEGKVDETLGPLVRDWDDGSPNKQTRLAGLLAMLGIASTDANDLRYQLLHRTAAAMIEARAFGVDRAVMLVHSFDPRHAWFDDFARFAERLGTPCPKPGRLSDWVRLHGLDLSIGWCADQPTP